MRRISWPQRLLLSHLEVFVRKDSKLKIRKELGEKDRNCKLGLISRRHSL